MNSVTFSVSQGVLYISCDAPPSEWRGHPDGMDVLDIRMLGETAALVLLEPTSGYGRVRNLVKIEVGGTVSWRGELPTTTSPDSFVSFEIEKDGHVSAATWSGYRVRLSSERGELLDSTFAK